ncbi:hypothetical protein I4U23_013410 [Adineta vaga]|nr:hypothetical protein I4U23_013410 [Adineta vaga]
MMRLLMTIFVAILPLLILGATSERDLKKRDVIEVHIQSVKTNDVLKWLCEDSPFASILSFCQSSATTTTSTSSTSTKSGTSTRVDQSIATSTSTTESPSALERAHWCRFSNGTYISRGYTFMHTSCDLCQCTQSRLIRCTTLQCMPTYCIDNTVPSRKSGQCCTQCAYEANSTQCVQSGITFPHGTIIKSTSNKIQCWCQLGTIECRKIGISIFSGLDLWGEGTAVYVLVIVLCVMLIFGTLLCGGCSLLYYYYYYYYNQQSAEQAYWENAGWQPMGEEEQVADADGEKKQAEAEQSQHEQSYPTGFSEEYVPPPYALYNGTYDNEQAHKEQKHI